jgi:hypothetical protein
MKPIEVSISLIFVTFVIVAVSSYYIAWIAFLQRKTFWRWYRELEWRVKNDHIIENNYEYIKSLFRDIKRNHYAGENKEIIETLETTFKNKFRDYILTDSDYVYADDMMNL